MRLLWPRPHAKRERGDDRGTDAVSPFRFSAASSVFPDLVFYVVVRILFLFCCCLAFLASMLSVLFFFFSLFCVLLCGVYLFVRCFWFVTTLRAVKEQERCTKETTKPSFWDWLGATMAKAVLHVRIRRFRPWGPRPSKKALFLFFCCRHLCRCVCVEKKPSLKTAHLVNCR